jgi:hypothetical protein
MTALPSALALHSSIAAENAEGCSRLAGREVVDGDRAAERHVEMCVRVDRARQDELPRRVDDDVRVDLE